MTREALTDLQLAVMRALWTIGEGGVSEVMDQLGEDGRELAPTTVATLLQRLAKQGWVAHRKVGRSFVYRARVSEQQAAAGALRRVVMAFFGGRASALTAQLLESERVSADELAEMRRLLERREKGH